MSEQYEILLAQLKGLLGGERNKIANLANASALLFHSLRDLNWAGFYLRENDELVLGPFQGKVACIRIPIGRGVCGTAAARNETQVVRDVSLFAGHIACDAASRSEIVVPIHDSRGEVAAALDLDSARLSRFSDDDKLGLEAVVKVLETIIDWEA